MNRINVSEQAVTETKEITSTSNYNTFLIKLNNASGKT